MANLDRVFQQFATLECRDSSPLYERLSLGIAEDPEILAMAARARRGQPVPNLFFAAVHWLLLQGGGHPLSAFYPSIAGVPAGDADPYGSFRSFCLEHREEIIHLISSRRVQTNVVRRCLGLLPAFGLASSQADKTAPGLSLVEIGAAAGLNLLWDRYGYRYGDGRHYGDSNRRSS